MPLYSCLNIYRDLTPKNYLQDGIEVKYNVKIINQYLHYPDVAELTSKISVEVMRGRMPQNNEGVSDKALIDFYSKPYVSRSLYNFIEKALPAEHKEDEKVIGSLAVGILKLKYWYSYFILTNTSRKEKERRKDEEAFYKFLLKYEAQKTSVNAIRIITGSGRYIPLPPYWFKILYDAYREKIEREDNWNWDDYLKGLNEPLPGSNKGNLSRLKSNELLRMYAVGFDKMLNKEFCITVAGTRHRIIGGLFSYVGIYTGANGQSYANQAEHFSDRVRKLIG